MTEVAGRLDVNEADAYRFLSSALRDRASRFMPGTMVLSQRIVPEPIPLRFPFLPYATNPDEAEVDAARDRQRTDTLMSDLIAMSGPKVQL